MVSHLDSFYNRGTREFIKLSRVLNLETIVSIGSYRIYSNKRRDAYSIFRATNAALIRGRRLFKNCTRQIYFFYTFIQRHTFYLTDT